MSDLEDLLDIKQAASFLGVSETSLRRWTNSGQLACLRLGGKRERRFRRADPLAFMETQPVTAASRPQAPDGRQHTIIAGMPVAFGTHLCALYGNDAGRTKLAAPLVTLCLYDVRRFESLEVIKALQGHTDMFRYPAAAAGVTGPYSPARCKGRSNPSHEASRSCGSAEIKVAAGGVA